MKVWVYLDGRQQGPFEFEQLLDMPVDQDTKVWFEGLDKWYPAGTLEQMRPLFDGSLTSVRNAHTEPETETAREVTEVIEIAEQPAGATAAAAAALHRQPDEPCPPTYLGWSIFLLICCCSPLSLAAVIASICTSSYYGRGRLDSARKASEVAAWLVMISIALGLIPVILMSCLFD
ncbi:MAG: DUF4339 domain-containing protein [Bacteroidales bacterium]|nr:DUF4339 domain-containing protein [Bacteroidales bacterium]MDE6437177.1 CD225/dispanin family protein [Muribaculaceae bacterium]